jgi:D-glucosaminate-6-phosphate ammonia-lyase
VPDADLGLRSDDPTPVRRSPPGVRGAQPATSSRSVEPARSAGSIYEHLGVRTIVNAAGTLTRLGGTLMLPEVVAAMEEASAAFVRIDELQARAGEIIAEVTGAESGYVVSGAAAGLLLATAAAMAGTDPARIARLPDASTMPDEVIMQAGHRMDYDRSVRTAGGRIVEIGYPGETMPWELDEVMSERTAAVLYAANRPAGSLPFPVVVQIAHAHGKPVFVDAAATLPPAANLRRFIAEGADLVVFSGGKALRGPQASGIIAGRADLIRAIALQHLDMDIRESTWASGPFAGPEGRPFHGIGRPLKVGKEEIVGVLVALRAYARRDHAADDARWREQVELIKGGVERLSGLTAVIQEEFNGRPQPVVVVDVDQERAGLNAAELVVRLGSGDPPICVNDGLVERGAFVINPFSLQEGEPELVVEQLRSHLQACKLEPSKKEES